MGIIVSQKAFEHYVRIMVRHVHKSSSGNKSIWWSQLRSESNSDQHEDSDILTICDGSKDEL